MTGEALILIDQQKAMEDAKWGPRNNPDAEQNIGRLLTAWRQRNWPIFHVKHDSKSAGSPFRPGQPGNDFLPLTAPLPGEPVIAKCVQSAFVGTDLTVRLEALGRPPLIICGVLLANSVEATVRVAANLGFDVYLPGDACWSCDKRDLTGRLWSAEDVHQLTLALLDGEYATVTTTDEVLGKR
ncbi:Nicotinamidase-related amidase [Enhydrobacter aerosaccus]|uniref:Nicotinamidase-related amidase n=1 Tax=Enhydrobacter aerosaccus TaxID=225324 RepID=A0A1T4KM08_9HYPH|nr:cysteine hydrolase family protein [Enhydrobacter aerosaccus]SJZ43472.1 Nicotinamidase-related amidase [Enhydrobacter aerosaccus]